MDETLARVNAEIAYARSRCPFYAALPAAPLPDWEAFRRLPCTTTTDIIQSAQQMYCVPASDIRRMVTSGTTGERKRLAFSDRDIRATVDFFCDGMRRLSKTGDAVMICMPGDTVDGVGALLSEGLRAFGAVPTVFGPIRDFDAAARFLREKRPDGVVGLPVQIRRLALSSPAFRPQYVLLSADYAADSLQSTIARLWQCPVYLHYGMTETGLGCAVETPQKDGMHIRKDLYVETVDGELVVTTLGREAMPFIRYRTGDMGTLLPNGRIGRVHGRLTELKKPVPIYALDERLFGCDDILDFSAEMTDGRLTVRVSGDCRAARALLPDYHAVIAPGGGVDSDGWQKRGTLMG